MKLHELFEGRVKQLAYDLEYDRATARKPAEFNVMINGKIWRRNGVAVPFKDYAAALRAANKITADRNITTQVVQSKKN